MCNTPCQSSWLTMLKIFYWRLITFLQGSILVDTHKHERIVTSKNVWEPFWIAIYICAPQIIMDGSLIMLGTPSPRPTINSQWIVNAVIAWNVFYHNVHWALKNNRFSVITIHHWSTIDKWKGAMYGNLFETLVTITREILILTFLSGVLGWLRRGLDNSTQHSRTMNST